MNQEDLFQIVRASTWTRNCVVVEGRQKPRLKHNPSGQLKLSGSNFKTLKLTRLYYFNDYKTQRYHRQHKMYFKRIAPTICITVIAREVKLRNGKGIVKLTNVLLFQQQRKYPQIKSSDKNLCILGSSLIFIGLMSFTQNVASSGVM